MKFFQTALHDHPVTFVREHMAERYHFTVTPIDDIQAYRAQRVLQEAKDAEARASKLEAKKVRIAANWHPEGHWPDMVKKAAAKAPPSPRPAPIHKFSLKERVVSWCLKLLNDAFPS